LSKIESCFFFVLLKVENGVEFGGQWREAVAVPRSVLPRADVQRCSCGTHRPLQVKSAGIDDDDVLMWSKLRVRLQNTLNKCLH